MIQRTYLISALVAAVFFSGCTVGPHYRRPESKLGNEYPKLKTKEATSAQPDDSWWQAFNDPTLTALVKEALDQNLNLRSAEARVRQARAERNAVAGTFEPTLDASGRLARDSASRNGPQYSHFPATVPNTQNDFRAGFDASWELDFFGHNRRTLQAANARVGVSQENRNAVALTVAGEVARVYVGYRTYESRIGILNRNIAIQEDTLKLVRVREKAGIATKFDVARAESAWRALRAQMPELKAGMEVSVQSLSVLTGEPAKSIENSLSAPKPVPHVDEKVPVGLPSDLLRRRPDIRRAERELAAATANVGAAVANEFPRISLVGSLGVEAIHSGDITDAASRYWSIGPNLYLPLFNGGRLKSQVQANQEAEKAALYSYRQTVLAAFADVETALIRYGHQKETAAELRAAQVSAKTAVELAKKRYQVGDTSLSDVLEAESKLNDIDDQLSRLDGELAQSFVSLNKALGGGWQGASDNSSKS